MTLRGHQVKGLTVGEQTDINKGTTKEIHPGQVLTPSHDTHTPFTLTFAPRESPTELKMHVFGKPYNWRIHQR